MTRVNELEDTAIEIIRTWRIEEKKWLRQGNETTSGTCEKESVTLNIPVTGIPEGKGTENGIEKSI